MHSVAPAVDPRDMFAHSPRGRDRSVSDAARPADADSRPLPAAPLPRSASYTYFPHVADFLDDSPVLELRNPIAAEGLAAEAAPTTASNPPPSPIHPSPDADTALPNHLVVKQSSALRRSTSRFNPFSARSRDSSEEPRPDRKPAAPPEPAQPSSMSPARSLTRLRRKSWISPSRSSSPTKDGDAAGKTDRSRGIPTGHSPKKSPGLSVRIPGDSKANDSDGASTSKGRVLTKKPKPPVSGLSNTTPAPTLIDSNHPPPPPVPKSFSTEKLPTLGQSPATPTHVPPLPKTLVDKVKGSKKEPRKRDELWSVFRTLDGDLRK